MSLIRERVGATTVRAYRGDFKTLLAFDIGTDEARQGLAGFTIQVTPPNGPSYYLLNDLQFEFPGDHAQDRDELPCSTINAPLHKFRWLHVPGALHQGLDPAVGTYHYTVTPRYFDKKSLKPLDPSLSVALGIEVGRFEKGKLAVSCTRGFVQSQAFVHHFGLKARIEPVHHELRFDTGQAAGANGKGTFTFQQEYDWLGFTARDRLFSLINEVMANPDLSADVFAYDLDEPEFVTKLLSLAQAGRLRIIVDSAALHHNKSKPKPEDEFEALATAASDGCVKRGKFGRFAHDKVIIVSDKSTPKKVLTGSTNFSINGLYVNSNHILIYDDEKVATRYQSVFDEAWNSDVDRTKFLKSELSSQPFSFQSNDVPSTTITFAPHSTAMAKTVLNGIVDRINHESEIAATERRSVLFAIMDLGADKNNPVGTALKNLHTNTELFTYGISDTRSGITLYPVGKSEGVLVTGRPVKTKLPPPFSQVHGIGAGHQIHHKFVVCGFNGPEPVVYCGSSNLALGGEEQNGDNLLEIHDEDVATVFAIEAIALIDHFNFLDNYSNRQPEPTTATPMALPPGSAASQIGWTLGTTDAWVKKYFDPKDLHWLDRELFS
jgi:hypothetical protein